MPTILHKRHDCIGCGSCVSFAPQNWEMDQTDGKARLRGATSNGQFDIVDVPENDRIDNENAANACPMNIIRIQDTQKNI